jgi:ATP-dependent Clp protease ATP-binding subunit ClpC
VLLFDEIEKAHPDVFNLLLQLLDDGRLTDSQGRVVDFKNTLVIMTSNIGSRSIENSGSGLGFDIAETDLATAKYNRTKEQVNEALKLSFRPEFLNRLDEIVVFHQLTCDQVKQISVLLLEDVFNRLADRRIKIELTEPFKERLIDDGYKPSYGARPLRRAITRLVEDNLAKAILAGEIHEGETVVLDINSDGQVTVRAKEVRILSTQLTH